jgi:hypothetical protein
VKSLKQALVAELTTALATVLPDVPTGNLPRSIGHAVEDLADSILRWRASQQRPPRTATSRASSAESDALARLMDGQFHEEEDTAPAEPPVAATPAPVTLPEQPPVERKRRPRIPR